MADAPDKLDLEVDMPMPQGLRVTVDTPYRMLLVSDLGGGEQSSISGPARTW